MVGSNHPEGRYAKAYATLAASGFQLHWQSVPASKQGAHWYKGGNLRYLLSGVGKRPGHVTFVGRYGPMRCCLTLWCKACWLECAGQDPDPDLVPPSSFAGCPQMPQAIDGHCCPQGPWGL